jgi:hypothetical protein
LATSDGAVGVPQRNDVSLVQEPFGYVVTGQGGGIDDGCAYDLGYDPRPEIVRQDDERIRRHEV